MEEMSYKSMPIASLLLASSHQHACLSRAFAASGFILYEEACFPIVRAPNSRKCLASLGCGVEVETGIRVDGVYRYAP
jgi:hypothetical protein